MIQRLAQPSEMAALQPHDPDRHKWQLVLSSGQAAVAATARAGAGVNQAATITSVKASAWKTMPVGLEGNGSPKTTSPPTMPETLAAVLVTAMTGTGLAVLQTLGGCEERDDRGDDGDQQPRRREAQQAMRADHAGERLDADVGDTEEDSGSGAEHHAVVVARRADARAR